MGKIEKIGQLHLCIPNSRSVRYNFGFGLLASSASTRVMSNRSSADLPLEQLPGVGSSRVELFRRLGIRRPSICSSFFPREYIEPAELQPYHQLQSDTRTTVVGEVDSLDIRASQDGRTTVGVLLKLDQAGFVRLVWFNQPFRAQTITRGQRLQASGLIKSTGISFEMRHPEIQVLDDGDSVEPGLPRPVYRLTEGLKQRQIADAVKAALDKFEMTLQESLPVDILQKYSLLSIQNALRSIHQPRSMQEAERARTRFIFQELLVYQLALAMRRQRTIALSSAPPIVNSASIHHRILRRLGLDLTADQQKVIDEICTDLKKTVPMNRLLQGDVGSGKTAVAVYAMLVTVANGFQATFMAPTEILARQHFDRLSVALADAECEIGLLVGSLPASEKTDLQTQIAIGTVDIIVGTQALLSENVEFHKLGLAVIDEQHKFGVAQRASFRGNATQPHYLVLSATPIPRTLAMTAFGDLDVSVIRERPAGRTVVHTYLAKRDELQSWWNFLKEKVAEGRQAYIITPRVEGDEGSDIEGAESLFQRLKKQELNGLRVGYCMAESRHHKRMRR